jgi:hypothetical protein
MTDLEAEVHRWHQHRACDCEWDPHHGRVLLDVCRLCELAGIAPGPFDLDPDDDPPAGTDRQPRCGRTIGHLCTTSSTDGGNNCQTLICNRPAGHEGAC